MYLVRLLLRFMFSLFDQRSSNDLIFFKYYICFFLCMYMYTYVRMSQSGSCNRHTLFPHDVTFIKTVLTMRIGRGGNEDSISLPLPDGEMKADINIGEHRPVVLFAFFSINLFVIVSSSRNTIYSRESLPFVAQ